MRQVYRGYELYAARERSLGGWRNTYYWACRKRDGYMLIDSFSEGDSPQYLVGWMKRVIDELIDKHHGRTDKLDEALDGAD